MNSNFNDEQIKAYAAAFEEGDAIWCDGEWREVKEDRCTGLLKVYVNGDSKMINSGTFNESGVVIGARYSFKGMENPRRVTTLEHYELQGGEKIVWLGEDIDLTFGKTYVVESDSKHMGRLKITDDAGDRLLVGSAYFDRFKKINWGIIPRYEQVLKNEESKFKKGDKVLIASTFTGVIKSMSGNVSGDNIYEVSVIDKHGEERVNCYWERDLELYKEEPPAPKVVNEQSSSNEIALDEVAIHSEIITRLVKQTIKGVKKYGDPVRHDNLSTVEWIDHAIDESVDQIVYLTALKHSLLSKERAK